jgi:predicted unusual protein kinase regulating ubiquinone biosynthesis (AarF/ABC1/UbiB family)
MKEQSKIPTSKVERASEFVKTGFKLGGNYVKHYARKLRDPETTRENLDKENAEDIYKVLSELKGSALKVAQMMSLDRNLLPQAYQDKFMLSQYSAPPLSYPLVVKTFQEYFGKGPELVFDTFTRQAVNAASIGQVHQATHNGKKLAVKVQYPGVAQSIRSDLKMVKPFALRLFRINEKELNKYLVEVEEKLMEEANYSIELERSLELSDACRHLPGIGFPRYYPEYSSQRILTMDWIDGIHLNEFLSSNPSQEERNSFGQALWDFYDYQIHVLRKVHADPHPGNFLFTRDKRLIIIDFGCVKEIPDDFYQGYFSLLQKDIVHRQDELIDIFYNLEFIDHQDTESEREYFVDVFKEMIQMLGRPFHYQKFDFGNDDYFQEIFELGEKIQNSPQFRQSRSARGSRHGLYINRTYFGLYHLLNQLKAEVNTERPSRMVLTA